MVHTGYRPVMIICAFIILVDQAFTKKWQMDDKELPLNGNAPQPDG